MRWSYNLKPRRMERAQTASDARANKIDRLLAQRIREARMKSDLSALELANAIGISLKAYRSMERGDRRIHALELARLAMAHALPILFFFVVLPVLHIFNR